MATTRMLYEILYRFGPNGLLGSHAIYCDRITDDETGEVIVDKLLPATPIKDSKEAVKLLNATLISHADNNTAYKEQIEAKDAEMDKMSKAKDKELSEHAKAVKHLEANAATKDNAITELESQITELKKPPPGPSIEDRLADLEAMLK